MLPVAAQQEPVLSDARLEVMEAYDLLFHEDTNRLKIISTGRFSKSLDELPLDVYVISHEEILKTTKIN